MKSNCFGIIEEYIPMTSIVWFVASLETAGSLSRDSEGVSPT